MCCVCVCVCAGFEKEPALPSQTQTLMCTYNGRRVDWAAVRFEPIKEKHVKHRADKELIYQHLWHSHVPRQKQHIKYTNVSFIGIQKSSLSRVVAPENLHELPQFYKHWHDKLSDWLALCCETQSQPNPCKCSQIKAHAVSFLSWLKIELWYFMSLFNALTDHKKWQYSSSDSLASLSCYLMW